MPPLLLCPELDGDMAAEIGCWLGGNIIVVAGKGEDDLYFLALPLLPPPVPLAISSPVGVLPPLRTDKSNGLSCGGGIMAGSEVLAAVVSLIDVSLRGGDGNAMVTLCGGD